MTFTYHTNRGTAKRANGGWNRLQTVNNGQGGTITFAYDNIAQVYFNRNPRPTFFNKFFNMHRVKSKTVGDGLGNSYTWSYTYGEASVNTLDSQQFSNDTANNPNSATLFYAWKNNAKPNLAIREHKEFRGHASAIETDPTGAQIEHFFHQGDAGCTPTAAIESDPCFVSLRRQEFKKGREYRTVWKTSGGAILRATERLFTVDAVPNRTTPVDVVDYTSKSVRGLWRAWTYENRTDQKHYEGGSTPVVQTTTYSYDPNGGHQNGGGQYGNLTITNIHNGASNATGPLERVEHAFYATRDDETWNWTTNPPQYTINYLVDHTWGLSTYNGSNGLLALTHQFYDYNPTAGPIGTKGELTMTRQYHNLPLSCCANVTLQGSDTSYAYDSFGNQFSETTYAESGTFLNGTFSLPGAGSAGRTTNTFYDPTFHVFPTQVDPPVVNGVILTERAGYDYRMGTLTSVTDPNGNITSAQYDEFGRMLKLIKPGGSSTYPTLQAYYYNYDVPTQRGFAYLLVRQETANTSGAVRPEFQFYDGLGRLVQAKRESLDGAQMIVQDTRYDGLGRVVAQSQPRYVNETAATTFWNYTPTGGNLHRPTTTTYDAVGRPKVITTPDGATTEHRYGLDTTFIYDDVVDANRHRTQWRRDALGRLRMVLERAGNCGAWQYTCVAPHSTNRSALPSATVPCVHCSILRYCNAWNICRSAQAQTRLSSPSGAMPMTMLEISNESMIIAPTKCRRSRTMSEIV